MAEQVAITKEQFDDLFAKNQANEAIIQELASDLHALNRAQLQGIGLDSKLAARQALGRKTVQFNRHYNRMCQPSSIKGAPNLIDGYCVSAYEVVNIRLDEFDRIKKDFPDMMNADSKSFKDRPNYITTPDKDENGRFRWKLTPKPIKAATLIKNAQDVG